MSDDEKKNVNEALEKAKKAMEAESVDDIKKAQEELEKASHKLSEEMYKAAQEQAQAAGGPEGAQQGGPGAPGAEEKKEENVVDADYKVDDDKDKKE